MGTIENLPAVIDPGYQNIAVRRHILSDKIDYKSFDAPMLVSRMVADQYPEAMHDDVVVCVDYEVLPRDKWNKVVVTPAQYIFMGLAPAGGDSGKSVIAAVAMIAIAVVAPYAAAAILSTTVGAMGMTGAFLAAGIAMVGSLIIGMLFRPPTPDEHREEETFAITGTTNRARPGAGFRRVFGRRKIAPDIGALPFTITQGDDQYFYGLFDCGYGPLKVTDVRIGNQSITNFDEVDMNIIADATDGSQLQIYRNDHFTVKLGTMLEAGSPEIIQTSGPANAAVLDVGFPDGLIRNRSDGDRDPRTVELNIEYRKVGDSTWLPYSDLKTKGIGTGGTTQVDLLVQSQDVITDDLLTENPYEGSENVHVYRILEGTTVFRATTRQTTISISSGMIMYIGAQTMFITAATDLGGGLWELTSAVPLQTDIEVGRRSTTGTPPAVSEVTVGANLKRMEFMLNTTPAQSLTITRTKSRPFTVSFQFEFPNADQENPDQWELRVTRVTPDVDDSNTKIQDNTQLNSLRTIRYVSPISWDDPHTIIELKIKATDQISGNLDNLTCIVQSKHATYNRQGDVTNPEALTRNPAWHALHVLLSPENPRPVTPDRIDWDSWVDFSQWCNSPDPIKGEARHRCDIEILGTGTVQRVVETILNTGRGTISMADGKYAVLWDAEPTVPVQLISTHNSNSMSATRSFVDIPNAIRAHFVDPQTDWEQAELIVYNDGYDETNAVTYEDMTLVGITRSNQVFRDVRYHIAQGILRQETLSVTMDWENLVATRGDLVMVQEESIFLGGLPGRITNITGNNVRSSEPFNLQTGQYAVRLRNSHGEVILVDITAQVDQYTVTLASIPTNLKVGDLLVWGVKDLETFPYIVKAVRPRGNLEAELALMQLAPGVYTADTDPIPPYSPGLSPDLEAAPIIEAELAAELIARDGPPAWTIVTEWEPIPRLITYHIWIWSRNEPEWKIFGTAGEGEDRFTIFEDFRLDPDNYDGSNVYRIKVTGVNVYGRESSFPDTPWVEFDPEAFLGEAPPELAYFDIDVRGEEVFLEWEVEDGYENIGGFIIKYTPALGNVSKATWWLSQFLSRDVAWDRRTATFPARVGTYMIKTVNAYGTPAEFPNFAKTTIPALPNLKFLETIDDAPEWPGVKNLVQEHKSALYLAKDPDGNYFPNGYYEYSTVLDLKEIMTVRLFSYFSWFAAGESTLMSTWTAMSDIDPLTEPAPDGACDAIQEVNIYDPEKGAFQGWRPFIAGDHTGQRFKFRIQMATSDEERYTPVVGDGELEVEIPYRVEQAFDMVIPASGTRVEYERAFFDPPALGVSAANEINEWFKITNETRTGFDIQFYSRASRFNGFGAKPIQGVIDFQARGYGARERAIKSKHSDETTSEVVLSPRPVGRRQSQRVKVIRRAT